ncbi:MAG: class I SAM-dependent methyltransferase [Tunicatimonas sp.]
MVGGEPNTFFKQKIDRLPPEKLLLPGEGEGRNALYAASLGWQVTAFDTSEVARSRAIHQASQEGLSLHYEVTSAEKFEGEENSFSAMALIFFHLPAEQRKVIHRRLESCLAKEGKLIITGFGKKQLDYDSGGPKEPAMLYSLEELKQDFTQLRWLEEIDQVAELEEGNGHQGLGHLISLFGEKVR